MAQKGVLPVGDSGIGSFVPPAPAVLAGLGAISAGALAALAVELADASASPVGVRVGFLGAMLVAVLGIFAVLYCAQMRRAFIEICVSEALDIEIRCGSAQELTSLDTSALKLTITRLGELANMLRKTAAWEAGRVDDIRRDLITRLPPGDGSRS
jgi:hypothetical protein